MLDHYSPWRTVPPHRPYRIPNQHGVVINMQYSIVSRTLEDYLIVGTNMQIGYILHGSMNSSTCRCGLDMCAPSPKISQAPYSVLLCHGLPVNTNSRLLSVTIHNTPRSRTKALRIWHLQPILSISSHPGTHNHHRIPDWPPTNQPSITHQKGTNVTSLSHVTLSAMAFH